ncbi:MULTISPECIES: hypothetical protein [unclassified Paenibacillus]|uniref:hypothetical protein n=1 Tax=unclassified Paenibacillus TaxID=185978 RepID=UPI00362681CE
MNVYIVKKRMDKTHETIAAVFSTPQKAEAYIYQVDELQDKHWIETWIVDFYADQKTMKQR